MKVRELFRDAYLRTTLSMSTLLFIISAVIAYVALKDVDHLLVIHFTNVGGIDFLGTKRDVFEIVATGFLVSFINAFLVTIFYRRIRFFSYLLSSFNIFFAVLILIAVAVIINVN